MTNDKPEIDTSNRFCVGGGGDRIQILIPPLGPLPKAHALILAAWIVAIADPLGEEFPAVLEAVCKG